MLNRVFIALSLILISQNLYAVFEDLQSGLRAQAMGGAYTAVSDGVDGVHFNPAGLNRIENVDLSSFYKILYGGLNEGLHHIFVSGGKRIKKSVLAISISETGADLKGEYSGRYSEGSITLSYSHSLQGGLSFGSNLNIYLLNDPRFGSTYTWGIDIGIITTLYRIWHIGVFVHNLTRPQIQGTYRNYDLPRFLSFGIAIEPAKGIITSFDIRKEEDFPARVSLGEEVYLWDNMAIRGGVTSEGELKKFSTGLVLILSGLRIGYTLQFDPNLPLTHIIGLNWRD